jgi:predicted amidohydrolase YtcJ
MFLFAAISQAEQPAADLVLLNGDIWTVDERNPRAEAVASIGSRIVAVGSSADVKRWIGPATKVVDLGGKFVVPGFNDAHVHFLTGGQHLADVKLAGCGADLREHSRITTRARGRAGKRG